GRRTRSVRPGECDRGGRAHARRLPYGRVLPGLEGPAGEGDVRTWPTGEEGCRDLYILLNPPSGTALLKAPAQEFKAFLQETEAVVPQGAELDHSDFDRLLAHFLAEG
ncbi:SsgA family sporulation/cell division regulator, partial [Streptomyces sp. NPDC001215]